MGRAHLMAPQRSGAWGGGNCGQIIGFAHAPGPFPMPPELQAHENRTQVHQAGQRLYDPAAPCVDAARQMEDEGQKIIKLNIGNMAPFGFDPPEEVVQDMIRNLPDRPRAIPTARGIFAARKAVMHYTQQQGIAGVTLDDIYLGNGASELIVMATQALLNDGDELLLPAPDYPLWTAATSLAGGVPVHYLCDESNGWMPSLEDIRAKITPRTKGIVVINPNNPTGALYPTDALCGIVHGARARPGDRLADEVYDKVLYDGVKSTAMASLSDDVLTLTFNWLSKAHRSCGYRAGWMVVSGDKRAARTTSRPEHAGQHAARRQRSQWAIQTALGGYQSINDLVAKAAACAASATWPTNSSPPSRRHRQAPGGAVHVPAPGPRDVPHRGRPPVLHGAAARHARDAGAGLGLQLTPTTSISASSSAARGRPARGHRRHGGLPGQLPAAPSHNA